MHVRVRVSGGEKQSLSVRIRENIDYDKWEWGNEAPNQFLRLPFSQTMSLLDLWGRKTASGPPPLTHTHTFHTGQGWREPGESGEHNLPATILLVSSFLTFTNYHVGWKVLN